MKKLRPHQLEALAAILSTFETKDRAQVHMACGTGKTIIPPAVYAKLAPKHTIVFLPSLALVSQTIASWREQLGSFRYLVVCGDPTVEKKRALEADENVENIDFATVTTDPAVVQTFLETGPGVVFCTYQSFESLRGLRFNFGVFDEAHKTAVPTNGLYGRARYNKNLVIDKRLFMTATPKDLRTGLGMDNEELYGPVAYKLPFSRGIQPQEDGRPLILPYKICLFQSDVHKGGEMDDAENAVLLMIQKGLKEKLFRKGITFHRLTKAARAFQMALEGMGVRSLYFAGTQNQGVRQGLMRSLQSDETCIATNARCLTEGVDVPSMDAVFFVDPKKSTIDIVQAAGRVMRVDRKNSGKEHGLVFMPVAVPPGEDPTSVVARTKYREIGRILGSLLDSNDILRAAANGKIKEKLTGEKPDGPALEDYVINFAGMPEDAYQLCLMDVAVEATGLVGDWMDNAEGLRRYRIENGVWPDRTLRAGRFLSAQRSLISSGAILPARHEILRSIPGWQDKVRDVKTDNEWLAVDGFMDPNISGPELSRRTGIPLASVGGARARHGWKPAQKRIRGRDWDRIEGFFDGAVSHFTIAKATGIHHSTIARARKIHGVKMDDMALKEAFIASAKKGAVNRGCPIVVQHPNGKEQPFGSISEAAEALNCHRSNIRDCLRGHRSTVSGCSFRYASKRCAPAPIDFGDAGTPT